MQVKHSLAQNGGRIYGIDSGACPTVPKIARHQKMQ